MEPAQIILLAIAAIGLLLLALLFYLLVLMPKERGPRPPEVTQAPQPPVHETEPAPRAPLTHIPGMDSVHQHDGAAAPQRAQARPTDRTPPSGIPRSELRDLLTDTGVRGDDRTPAGGMSALSAPRRPAVDRDTAPQQPVSAAPPRKRTVALHANFLDDDGPHIAPPTLAPPRPQTAAQTRATPPRQPALSTTPSEAPIVQPAPRPVATTVTPRETATLQPAAQPTARTAAPTPAPTATPSPAAAPAAETRPRPATQVLFDADEPLFADPDPDDAQTAQLVSHELLPSRFRDRSRPAAQRVDAFTQLLAQTEPDEKVLLLVEAINEDLMELQLVALQEITARTQDTLLDEVIPLVESTSPEVALGAVRVLENIGGPIVEQALLVSVESAHPTVQARALDVLADNASSDLEEQLHELLQENDPRRVEVAARLLAKLGGPENAEALDVRAALTPAADSLYEILQRSAAAAHAIPQSTARQSDTAFGAAQPVKSDGLEEFELSLDPDLFGAKD